MAADAVAAFDGPDVVWKLADIAPHLGEPVPIGAEPATTQDCLVGGHHLDRDRPLVRIHPDHHTVPRVFHVPSPMLVPSLGVESGGQRYFELGHTPLEPLRTLATPGEAQAM
jgi:hypothetical protein